MKENNKVNPKSWEKNRKIIFWQFYKEKSAEICLKNEKIGTFVGVTQYEVGLT